MKFQGKKPDLTRSLNTMQDYWQEPDDSSWHGQITEDETAEPDKTLASEYDCHCRWLVENAAHGSILGWAAELCRYLDDLPANVSKGMNVISWWSKQASAYPTLAQITQDICAIPVFSVPCEHLFSAGAEIAIDRQSC